MADYSAIAKDILTRLPANADWGLTAKYAGGGAALGAGIGTIVELLREKKKRNWWNPLWWALAGGALGAGGSIVHNNLQEELGVKYAQPIKDVVKEVYPEADPNNPNKTYTIFFQPQELGKKKLSDRVVEDTGKHLGATVPAYYTKYLNDWLKTLPPSAKVNLVGFSYGGAMLHSALDDISRPIDNVIMVDPVAPFPEYIHKPQYNSLIKNLKVLAPQDLSDQNPGDVAISPFLGWAVNQVHPYYDAKHKFIRGNTHSMYNSPFRRDFMSSLSDSMRRLEALGKDPDNPDNYFYKDDAPSSDV